LPKNHDSRQNRSLAGNRLCQAHRLGLIGWEAQPTSDTPFSYPALPEFQLKDSCDEFQPRTVPSPWRRIRPCLRRPADAAAPIYGTEQITKRHPLRSEGLEACGEPAATPGMCELDAKLTTRLKLACLEIQMEIPLTPLFGPSVVTPLLTPGPRYCARARALRVRQ
jgi:hypothetical protein